MLKKVMTAGILGGLVLVVWTLVINGILGFQAAIDMKRIAAERQVYEILSENIISPGRYIFNPELTSEGRFPDGEPVFSVLYGGFGHESAGRFALVGLVLFFLAPIVAAWMLSQTSERVMLSYSRKLLFFVAIGVLFAVFTDFTNCGIGGYPINDTFLLAANHIVAWTLVGLVVAWRIKPVAE